MEIIIMVIECKVNGPVVMANPNADHSMRIILSLTIWKNDLLPRATGQFPPRDADTPVAVVVNSVLVFFVAHNHVLLKRLTGELLLTRENNSIVVRRGLPNSRDADPVNRQ
jgi:hypothetical protein